MRRLHQFAKSIPIVSKLYALLMQKGKSRIDVIEAFPEFAPASRGSYRMLAPLTIQGISQLTCSLLGLARKAKPLQEPVRIDDFVSSMETENTETLGALFEKYGSDKSHNRFHVLYAALLGHPASVSKLLEIGIGTNNRDVASHMGLTGRPGASLRAFRDFLPNAKIYGCDVDSRVLFEEERITTIQCDQTNPLSFDDVSDQLGEQFDLMIDDGLHSPHANFHSLTFFVDRLKSGGYAVVEDIPLHNKRLWQIAMLLLTPKFECHLVEFQACYLFVCKRKEDR